MYVIGRVAYTVRLDALTSLIVAVRSNERMTRPSHPRSLIRPAQLRQPQIVLVPIRLQKLPSFRALAIGF